MLNPNQIPEKLYIAYLVLIAIALPGCHPGPAVPKSSPSIPLTVKFDAKDTGIIRGQVVWAGPLPTIDPIKILVPPTDHPNPNAPTIDAKSLGMDQVLVYLKTVDPARSKSWPHDPVEVAFDNSRLDIRQGKTPVRIGIVRRGDEIACVAREKRNHILEARGASVFSLPLIDPDKITNRKLNDMGLLELSSGTAFFWLRGHVWIGDHPYAALTNAAGEFELTQVPAGKYDLVCWRPNWKIKRRERNPEFGEIERLVFENAREQSTPVTVTAGETATAIFAWSDPPTVK